MNKLYIIGNGFDLAHGLKTSYNDFLLWYFRMAADNALSNWNYEDELMKISNSRSGQVLKNEWVSSSESIQEIKEKLGRGGFQVEYKSDFFGKIISDSYTNWVNIENAYYQLVRDEIKPIRENRKGITQLTKLNSDLEYIKNKLVEYLREVFENLNLKTSHSEYSKILRKKNALDFNFSEALGGDMNKALKQSKTLFLNFSYTPLLKHYYDLLFSKDDCYKLIQIHGIIEKSESVVFGFGDELDDQYHEMEKLNNNEFFKHIKSFKYFQDKNYQKLMSFVDSDDFEVIVLGHSLGLSDRTMLSQIFEHKNLKQVQLYYYQDKEGNNDFTEKTYEISRHFSDKGRMRLKVVNFQDSKPMPQVDLEESE